MNAADEFAAILRPDDDHTEALDEGAYWLLQLVAAVDFLRRGDRHRFTVWDALEEALTWWNAEQPDPNRGRPEDGADGEPDLLRVAFTEVASSSARLGMDTSEAAQQAVRHWVDTITQLYNDGRPWPHPIFR